MTIFSERLIEARKRKKISQRELGVRLNKSFTMVGKYERGETTPPLEVIYEICNILDVSISYLVDNTGELNFLKDKEMIRRFNDIINLPSEDKNSVAHIVDVMIRDAKARQTYK